MSDLITKLNSIANIKESMRIKLGLATTVPFSKYTSNIPSTEWSESDWQTLYDSIKNNSSYTRPTDWLTMPSLSDGDEKCVILNPIYDTDSNFVALSAEGAYTVDWGDGTVENFATSVKAEHAYTYSSIADSTLTSEGFKQVLITITPQVAGTLTLLNLTQKHTKSPLISSAFLDVVVAGHKISTVSCLNLIYLEIFTFVGTNNITNFASMFQGCTSLQTIPLLNTANGIIFSNMFQGCTSLQTIPSLNTSKGTDFSNMFYCCPSLQTIPLLNTANGTTFLNMFNGCTSLQTIPLIDTSKGTNFSGMFQGCSSLQTIPLLNTANGIIFSNMFYCCSSLQTIPLLDTSKGTNFASMIAYSYKISKAAFTGTKYSISYASCTLSRQAIVDIFNALGTASSQTITLTGNYGASSLTTEDKAIATAKGWTITIQY
jgi:hypothetical protein